MNEQANKQQTNKCSRPINVFRCSEKNVLTSFHVYVLGALQVVLLQLNTVDNKWSCVFKSSNTVKCSMVTL